MQKASAQQNRSAPAPIRKRILVVDDHPLVREGVIMVVNQQSDMTVCGEADSRATALKALADTHPDLVVLDISLRDANGLEIIKEILARNPRLPILVLSMHDEIFYAPRVLHAGAKGYVMKSQGIHSLIEGIQAVLRGEIFVSENLRHQLVNKMFGGSTAAQNVLPEHKLSDRELEIYEFIGCGNSVTEIADKLHLSAKTVETHIKHIKLKVGLKNVTALVQHAAQWVNTK